MLYKPMRLSFLRSLFLLAPALAAPSIYCQQPQTLLATPQTVVWGNYNSAAKPALTVHSGDTVTPPPPHPDPQHLRLAPAPRSRRRRSGRHPTLCRRHLQELSRRPERTRRPHPYRPRRPSRGRTRRRSRSSHPENQPRRALGLQLLRRWSRLSARRLSLLAHQNHPARPRPHARPLRPRRRYPAASLLRLHGHCHTRPASPIPHHPG